MTIVVDCYQKESANIVENVKLEEIYKYRIDNSKYNGYNSLNETGTKQHIAHKRFLVLKRLVLYVH